MLAAFPFESQERKRKFTSSWAQELLSVEIFGILYQKSSNSVYEVFKSLLSTVLMFQTLEGFKTIMR